MDLGNIIYVIAVIGYFIYQATKKKRADELPDSPENSPEPPQKGMTFEELLKEIRNAQNPIPQPEPPKPEPVRPIPAPAYQAKAVKRKPVEVEEVDDEVSHYEGSFEPKKVNPYQAYAQTHSIPSTPLKRIDYDALSPKKVNPYAELLKNPKTLKQAVVVSEILKPKYF